MFPIGNQSSRLQNVFTQGSSSFSSALFSFSSLQLFFYLLLISQTPFILPPRLPPPQLPRPHLLSCPYPSSLAPPPLLLYGCKAFSFSAISKVSPSGSLRGPRKIYIKTYESLVFLNILLLCRWYCDLPHTVIGCSSIDFFFKGRREIRQFLFYECNVKKQSIKCM